MEDIVKKADDFILHLFKEKLPNTFVYHNYTHSKRVYKSVNEIIENTELSERDTLVLRLSALLHDTGYIVKRDGHEEESVKIANAFLKENNVDEEIIASVDKCIMATKFKGTPDTALEEMIRDADSSHFGQEYFEEASEFLRQEYDLQDVNSYSPRDWRDENITVLIKKHKYYSDYALKTWQPQKEKNLADLIKSRKKDKKKLGKEKLKAQYKADAKNSSPERGIQTFYRVALRNHIKLSDIADTKANILLSVNAIIISLVLANLLSKLDTNSFLIIPTAIFVISSATTMILSVIATRPNVTRGEFTKEDVENKSVNLTFFGNFHKMELSQFQWAITELLKDKNYVYDSLTMDLYYLGVVLDRKYRILRLTYTIFVSGTIISILAFGISFYISGRPPMEIVQP